jgi:hypothetical protein
MPDFLVHCTDNPNEGSIVVLERAFDDQGKATDNSLKPEGAKVAHDGI